MNYTELKIEKDQVHKLLCAANGDAALLFVYLQSGNRLENAEQDLGMKIARQQCAAACLRQLGLWQEEKSKLILVGERPNYSEADVVNALDVDRQFRSLYQEIQGLMGRNLNTEEIKILLGFVRYLGLPGDVICLLFRYCKERNISRGSNRNPSLRTLEKEAYLWADKGIDTMEEAIAYMQGQTLRRSRLGKLMQVLQIHGRNLTPGEERYAQQWLDWGFDDGAVAMAYERTCLNTGGLRWPYMNKILAHWHEAGLHTAEQIRAGDQKQTPHGATGQLGDAELEAIQKMMREG